nr:hypothetical protein [Deltaproteobacteria bacterium]
MGDARAPAHHSRRATVTGLQLVAWREKRKLSQVAAMTSWELGGVQTIKRAELVPGRHPPQAFLEAGWGA